MMLILWNSTSQISEVLQHSVGGKWTRPLAAKANSIIVLFVLLFCVAKNPDFKRGHFC